MKKRKRSIAATVEIDGFPLRWSLLREPQWTTTDGYKGLTFSVRADLPKTFRELQLEFPYPKKKPGHPVPEKQRILPQVVEAGIRQAMAAGWKPKSRGRVFAFQVPESPA